jgi:hypothetical protein
MVINQEISYFASMTINICAYFKEIKDELMKQRFFLKHFVNFLTFSMM